MTNYQLEKQQLTPETSQQEKDQLETQQLYPENFQHFADVWLSILLGPTLFSTPETINVKEYFTNLELIFKEEDQELSDLD